MYKTAGGREVCACLKPSALLTDTHGIDGSTQTSTTSAPSVSPECVYDSLQARVQTKLVLFSSTLTDLQANKFDISLGEFYITDERVKVADLETSWATVATFLVRKDSGFMPARLADACVDTVAG
ncbi:transporter substrate-binding domain-containing protein [Rhizobium sp. 2YAF20]|uniref:transporter substrate-binding domain-containing protein n=1 Tax=Rhizobium sp. 2YAF20 TaxID=3233027 RepID=UPI003F9E4808